MSKFGIYETIAHIQHIFVLLRSIIIFVNNKLNLLVYVEYTSL